VGLADHQQRAERGTTRAGMLLAVVAVVAVVVLIQIGYAAHGLRRGGAGGGRFTEETEIALAFEDALRAGEA
jgi:hypothetical protein